MGKIFRKRWTAVVLALALVIGLVPPMPEPVQAAAVIQILERSTDRDNPQPVTTETINLKVSVTGISPSEYSNLYAEVFNITSGGAPTVVRNPLITGDNEVTFPSVQLTQGVNEIFVRYGETSTVSSLPVYVLYTPVPYITDLRIDGEPFVDGGIYPREPRERFFITGKAPNATSVEIRLRGDTQRHFAVVANGEFYILVEDATVTRGSQTNFKLRPGNHEIDIIASNATSTYHVKRKFIYDNGYPFAYDVQLIETTNGNATHDLAASPTVTSKELKVTGKVKVNRTTIQSPGQPPQTVPEYIYGTIDTSSGVDFAFSFETLPAPTADSSITQELATSEYVIYKFEHKFTINDDRNQGITFRFQHRSEPSRNVNQDFNFFFQDTNGAYVEKVHMVLPDGSLGPQLSDTAVNPINDFPSKLRVYVNDNTSSIKAFLGDNRNIDLTPAAITPTGTYPERYADVTIGSQIQDDTYKLEIVPYKGSAEYSQGIRMYTIQLNRVPYLVLTSLANGQVLRNVSDLKCSGESAPCLEGRLINTTFADQADVEVWVDGVYHPWRTDKPQPTTGTSFKFVFDSNFDLEDGQHELTLRLYFKTSGNDKRLVSERTVIFYVLSQETPSIDDIALWSISSAVTGNSGNEFQPGSLPDTYVTNEPFVRLTGSVFNADGNSSLSITVRTRDGNGQPRTATDRFNRLSNLNDRDSINTNGAAIEVQTSGAIIPRNIIWNDADVDPVTPPNGDPYWRFGTYFIVLQPTGDTIIELSVTNKTGTVTRTITITREPVPYRIIEPGNIIKNANGVDQVNINSNFLRIKLEAEGADRVEFGRNQAERDLTAANNYTFVYEVKNLKKGANRIRFTVWRGSQRVNGELIAYNINTPTIGATFKTEIDTRITAFEGLVQLRFPRNTLLVRNDPDDPAPIISADREILFGIADTDGRVDRVKHSIATNPDVALGSFWLQPPFRFRLASPLIWIDAGSIRDKLPSESEESYMQEALTGSGQDPYDDTVFFRRLESDQFVPTQRGELTIKFDPSIRADAWRYLTVFVWDVYEDYRGITTFGWRNLGGVVDTRNNTITVPFDKFGYYAVMYMYNSFNDVINHNWARNAMDTLYSKGYMLNELEDAFGPNSPITRGEFATLLVKIFDIPLQYDDNESFTDVPRFDPTGSSRGLWDYKYIETAARVGIVRGTTFNRFNPTASITRQDAAVMIARAAELKLESNEARALTSLQKQFTDANLIDIYARAAVDAVVKKGFIQGKANTLQPGQTKQTFRFDPLETFTRAEAAEVAMRVLADLKKIPR